MIKFIMHLRKCVLEDVLLKRKHPRICVCLVREVCSTEACVIARSGFFFSSSGPKCHGYTICHSFNRFGGEDKINCSNVLICAARGETDVPAR